MLGEVGKAPVNLVAGLLLALSFAFVMAPDTEGVSKKDAAIAFVSACGVWVVVLWLKSGMQSSGTSISWIGVPRATAGAAAAASPATGTVFIVLAVSLLLALGLLAFAAMIAPRLWRVPVWMLCIAASVLALLPYALFKTLAPIEVQHPLALAILLEVPWMVAFMTSLAYGLTSINPRPYGDHIKQGTEHG